MFNFIKTTISLFFEIKKNKKIYYSDKYYKDVNEIPLLNWWKCSNGDLKYLWKKHNDDIPYFFKAVFTKMYYQFDYIDLEELRRQTKVLALKNKYLSTKDIRWKRKADTKEAELKLLSKKSDKEIKLNDLIKFVQSVLNITYYLDSTKISAGYFFSLYDDAKKTVAKNGNNR